ncbi:vacuolar calcium ion transporter /H(+) exchanger [Bimuria novae-zelandiae CBS 107.79]|uniref:Vacuolar calcium ion transporter /H(+) exchanger n=1 Tax=Bimuria novae-zelandiae CBS 107.79 TaxID=1447943 RepID=A0A6A5VQS1_9PLEO|nr:vacuolar calcium ion transporter /H(+) exchanger [Bimuria novae-zelandiae CBS 107.79]
MGETDEPPLSRTIKSTAAALGLGRRKDPSVLPSTHSPQNGSTRSASRTSLSEKPGPSNSHSIDASHNHGAEKSSSTASPPVESTVEGETSSALEPKGHMLTRMKNGTIRFGRHTKDALLYSWINALLIFVPIGIAVHAAGLGPEIVFSMNAVAIIPLAGLLAHATEAVAARVGDTLGALLNVSFGNAVELILFIILLAGDQIEVVQAALLGSILANLLLILGMAFLLGGLRYQEQVYNSTVTQMSACMLSLAVMSLLLPTAFHAAFNSNAIADKETLQVSRGTSVVLLLVYILYLVFQLKSHTYMYASTPQHIIDEESHPGVMAGVFDSSSSDSSSSSSSSDSDSSAGSHTTAKSKIKRAVRRMRRKSSASSKETPDLPSVMTSPSVERHNNYFDLQRNGTGDETTLHSPNAMSRRGSLTAIVSGDEADVDDYAPVARDFEAASSGSLPTTKREKRKSKHKKKHRKHHVEDPEKAEIAPSPVPQTGTAPKVAFAEEVKLGEATAVAAKRPTFRPSLLSENVFRTPQNPAPVGAPVPNLRVAAARTLRRTKSEPEDIRRMDSETSAITRPSPARLVSGVPSVHTVEAEEEVPEMSRTAAIMMLVISTALVAVCADFMSDAIEPMVEKTHVSQAFIGLIILPIVGNAAEHVTAVTVAMKNKMDLSIGVAVGSSIQIAIFITPFIVILGWMMDKPMTLYFNIFETVALFVTAFVVNFLVLDGRSNYLEGSLLIAAYVIIALASFFYPDGCDASQIGGSADSCGSGTTDAAVSHAAMLVKRMVGM